MLSNLFLTLTTIAVTAQASHSFNDNHISQYTFTQNVSLDLEDASCPQPTPLPSASPPPPSSLVCSSLICDDEFLISAMMINGGDMQYPLSGLNSAESDDDQDDDDDDDGHSSMLSNVSLRRSLATSKWPTSSFAQDMAVHSSFESKHPKSSPAFVSLRRHN